MFHWPTDIQYAFVKVCESTNDLAQKYVISNSCDHLQVFAAEHQTSGRGQQGSVWQDERGAHALFSVILPTFGMPLRQAPLMNMHISSIICEALSSLSSKEVQIKWPNDFLIEEKKVGGMLIEMASQGQKAGKIIAGIGINVRSQPKGIPHATFLGEYEDHSPEKVIKSCAELLASQWLAGFRQRTEDIIHRYHSHLAGWNTSRLFKIGDEVREGRIVRVDEAGRLVLQWRDQEMLSVFRNKEISYLY